MSSQLFQKAAFFTDLHFGRKGNSPVANEDNIGFLRWALDRAKSWGAEILIIGGDWHDNRHQIGLHTLDYSLMGLEMVNAAFDKIYVIPGNHDLAYREKRDISSIEIARHLTNFHLIRDPTAIDDVTFLPWLVGDEHKNVGSIRTRYVFGHLEMPGFMMNAKVILPDSDGLAKADQFKKVDTVFTGHFHMRQQQGRVIYTGNIMPFDFSDANDADRGLMLLKWGSDPIFEAWPEQPLFRTVGVSELLEGTANLIQPKMTVRAKMDVPLTDEDAQELREMLIAEFGARKIELAAADDKPSLDSDAEIDTSEGMTIDQMVVEGLMALDTAGLSRDRLIEMYRGLADV